MGFYGFQTKQSFIDDVNVRDAINQKNIHVEISSYNPDITEAFVDTDNINGLSYLEAASPFIVKVKVNPNLKRELYYFCSLTYVDVLEVYKGDIKDKTLAVFEPMFFQNVDNQTHIYSLDGYNYMNEQDEYILFLKRSEDSHYSTFDYVYLPTTTIYSKYNISSNQEFSILPNSDYITYDSVCNNDVLFTDNNRCKLYNQLKKEISEKWIQ